MQTPTCDLCDFRQSSSQPSACEPRRIWCVWLRKNIWQWCVRCVSLNTCHATRCHFWIHRGQSQRWVFAPEACSNSTSLPPKQVHVACGIKKELSCMTSQKRCYTIPPTSQWTTASATTLKISNDALAPLFRGNSASLPLNQVQLIWLHNTSQKHFAMVCKLC